MRQDFGKIIEVICNCCGGARIYQEYFMKKLEDSVKNA